MWHATSSLVRQNPKVINAFLEKARKIAAQERKRFKPADTFWALAFTTLKYLWIVFSIMESPSNPHIYTLHAVFSDFDRGYALYLWLIQALF